MYIPQRYSYEPVLDNDGHWVTADAYESLEEWKRDEIGWILDILDFNGWTPEIEDRLARIPEWFAKLIKKDIDEAIEMKVATAKAGES